MASSVFYKFMNSKEPERITFDGTGISVFELKREIIAASGLGDGTDFDLLLFPEDQPSSEYDDDTTIISRSSTVIAKRRPAARGHGRAARYVSGRAPVRAIKKGETAKPIASAVGGSEADAEAAFLAESAQVWAQEREALSHAKRVDFHKKKPVTVPTHDPPPGYVCYRCQKKGHWIQACPTNDDPDFKPAARAKRTTGIPRSFLQTVEKPSDEELEDARGIMLNAEGEYVRVMTDTKTWQKFQEKTNATKAQAATADAVSEEIRQRGLECSIDKRMFVDPVKTPCCGKTYCRECIENALAEGDLVCPNCSTDSVLIDDLTTDDETVGKIREFEAEKAKEKVEKELQAQEEVQATTAPLLPSNNESETVKDSHMNPSRSKSPQESTADAEISLTVAAHPTDANDNASDTDTSTTSKKRKEAPTEIKPPSAPKAMRMQKEQQTGNVPPESLAMEQKFLQDMEGLKNMMPNAAPTMPTMPPMNGGQWPAWNMAQGNPMWNMNNGYPGPMPGSYNPNMAAGYNGHMGAPYNNLIAGGYGNNMGYGNMNGMNGAYGQQGWNQQQGHPGYNQGPAAYGNMPYQNNTNPFPNQQQQASGGDAYERRPVNPHRAQNKHRKQRAPDYHYV